ncbi:hypothetical protein L3Q72_20820 [Vibrio sp. JC009]|uniref:hypothetical protein n=1 Tax=Vibrio sp. JC009 TaxID=2912314 RepID=UPI0023B108E7|nr:hypothetical protein [Vibrio sp. JC009]WED23681.1 hypothetical protein L3Q72_20820 [Vibrio sp. JC009]
MNKSEKIGAALEILSSEESIRELGTTSAELMAIRDRINTVITELEKAELSIGLYEVCGRQFKEPVKGPASSELQSEIDIHNEHTGDNKRKSDYLINVINA